MNILRYINRLAVVADQAVVSGTALLSSLFIARTSGVDGYGRFSAVVLLLFLLQAVQQAFISGVFQVNFSRISVHRRKAYTQAVLLGLVMLTTLLVLLVLLFRQLPFAFVQLFPASAAICVYAAAQLTADGVRRVLLARSNYKTVLLLDVCVSLLLLALLFMQRHTLTVEDALFTSAAALCPMLAASMWLFGRPVVQRSMWHLTLRIHFRQGRWLFYTALLQWCSGNLLMLALSARTGAAALGVLRLGQQLFSTFTLILQAAETYALPKAAALAAHSAQLAAGLRKMTFTLLLLYVPFALVLCLFARPLMQFIGGNDVPDSSSIIPALAAVYLLVTLGYSVRTALRSLHLNQLYFSGAILSVVAASFALLIPGADALAIVAGLFAAQFFPLCYWLIILHHKHHLTWKSFI
ncbi:MAG: hypothetical protein IM638_03900 [Bacteroidetes bacterium]|nr:hypothetical protein [Bacteroidota bacterium]